MQDLLIFFWMIYESKNGDSLQREHGMQKKARRKIFALFLIFKVLKFHSD